MSEIAQITAMREERYAAGERMKEIIRVADDNKRSLTAEEAQEFDRLEARVDELGADVARREKAAALQPKPRLLEQAADGELREYDPERREHEARANPASSKEYRAAFDKYMRGGHLDAAERRDLSVGTTTAGGFTVPTSMNDQLVQYAIQFGTIRARATVIVTSGGETLNVPRLTAYGTSGWVAEGGAFTESDPTFGNVSLSAYKATHIAQISEELLQDSNFDMAGLLTRVIGQNIGVLENTGFVVGSGSSQPTGICTSSTTVGKTGTTGQTTSVTADDLVDVEYSILPYYRRNASWTMKDATIAAVRKLRTGVSGDLTYLWSPGLSASQPDTLLGYPLFSDPDAPTMAANAYSIAFGDHSGYYIRVAGSFQVQRLNELYAGTGQVGFRGWERVDGKLVDAQAVKTYRNSAT